MKKKLLLLSVMFYSISLFGQWSSMNLDKLSGGAITDVRSVSGGNGALVIGAGDSCVYLSPSGKGGDWVQVGAKLATPILHFSVGDVLLACGNPYLYVFNVANNKWDTTSLTANVNQGLTQKKFGDTNYIYVPNWGDYIYISKDSAKTWTQYNTITSTPDTLNRPVDSVGLASKNIVGLYSFPNDTVIYGLDKKTGGEQELIYSLDKGKTWHWRIAGYYFSPRSLFSRMFNNERFVYYGGDNGNYNTKRSNDLGLTWTDRESGFANLRFITGADNKAIFALENDKGPKYSFDNGNNWLDFRTGIASPNLTGNLIAVDNVLYFANKTGGLYSCDFSAMPASSALYPDTVSVQSQTASLKFKSADASKVYYVVLAETAKTPNNVQIIAGVDGNNLAAITSSSSALINDEEKVLGVNGLNASTKYRIFSVLVNSVGNLSTVDSVVFVTKEMPLNASIAPAGLQTIKKDIDGTQLSVTANKSVTSFQWKSATVSGGSYTNLSSTIATYTPNFSVVDTFYVVCDVTSGAETVTTNEVVVIVENPVGQKNIVNKGFSVYPSPASTKINITGVSNGSLVEIIDILGNRVNSVIAQNSNIEFNVSQLSKGIYFVKVGSAITKFVVE